MVEVMNDIDEVASAFSSDFEQERPTPGWNTAFGSHFAFWTRDTLVSCVCGATPDTYCTCLPTSLDFVPEGDYSHQPPTPQDYGDLANPESAFSTIEPQIREDSRPAVPTRKERRRQQNRAAQVRHRDKRNRFLHETMRNVEAMNEELKQTRAQRDYFRLMYEDLETQMMEMKSQSSSRVQSSSPRQN
ncbi:hypothetical protein A1O7_02488 [Cladophialophora yegresii CBS 114405]|uniref:BZIP domain-containing protein n=1 Tax=Cladophialophora yegresii CBS 114405 TaxID=1182544 RepID=W9WAP0_9EURO|nr:uncharacterized protein A1O7_02488 [Cladophialophora yegresii CBS 114405]EXJ62055.1 hypothetical protein A1O7_02488 [Cladophialophora yegresii CBS 114405]